MASPKSPPSVKSVRAEDYNRAAQEADAYDYEEVALPEIREGAVPSTEKCLAKPKSKRNSRGVDR